MTDLQKRGSFVARGVRWAFPKILVKSVVMTVVIAVLTLPSINLLNGVVNVGVTNAVDSVLFLIDFAGILVVLAVYDLLTSRRVWPIEDLLAAFLVVFLLAATLVTPLSLLAVFVLFLGGTTGGAALRQLSLNKRSMTRMVGGSIAFLLIIWAVAVVLTNSNYYSPPSGSSINLNAPYLTQSQIRGVYGSGIYSETPLNAAELPLGSLYLLFPTPIQTLLFNFTFQNTNAGSSYYVTFYNRTYLSNFTELVVQTPQAGIILATQAPHAKFSGTVGNVQYIGQLSANPVSFTVLAQKSDFLAVLSCEGTLCTQPSLNGILKVVFGGAS